MTSTLRSPGLHAETFHHGLAMEEGLIAQETLIEHRPADFYGYRPKNFDMTYQGDVSDAAGPATIAQLPAIRLLDAVGRSGLCRASASPSYADAP